MLSPKQEKFCLEYAASGNATEAYLKAGYDVARKTAEVNGCQMLKKPKVQKRLEELSSTVRCEKIATIAECQEMLTAIARNESNEPSDRIKAIQILMKAQGAFVTQINFQSAPIVISGGEQLED